MVAASPEYPTMKATQKCRERSKPCTQSPHRHTFYDFVSSAPLVIGNHHLQIHRLPEFPGESLKM
jgi:hypothetical protein